MSRYIYQKPVRRSRYADFRRYLFAVVFLVIVIGGIAFFIYSGLSQKQQDAPVSSTQTSEVTDPKTTTTSPYFEFQDNGKWVLDKNGTTDSKFVYSKFRKNIILHTVNIFVDHTPTPLDLSAGRVLPVRIVNNNSLDITTVSDLCGKQYAKGELHKVKEISINGATMLCDPDAQTYTAILSEIGGDYRLKMVRPGGKPIQFVITYQDHTLDPQPQSLLNIASSFKTR